MSKSIQSFYGIIFITLLFIGCNNTNNQSKPNDLTSDTTKNKTNTQIDTTKKEPIRLPENKLLISFKTKLVEWGGDGKWHDMTQEMDEQYFVNYADPFKIILSGYYTDLTIKIKTSGGKIIFNKSGIEISEKEDYIVKNDKMIGETETNFIVEIKQQDKVLYKGYIESMPGGE